MEEALEKDVGSGGWVGKSTVLEESLFVQLSVLHLLCLACSDFKDTVIPLECIKQFLFQVYIFMHSAKVIIL